MMIKDEHANIDIAIQEINTEHQGRRQKFRRVVEVSAAFIRSEIQRQTSLFDLISNLCFDRISDHRTITGLEIQGSMTIAIVAVADSQVLAAGGFPSLHIS